MAGGPSGSLEAVAGERLRIFALHVGEGESMIALSVEPCGTGLTDENEAGAIGQLELLRALRCREAAVSR